MKHSKILGFTLVELLVVITIIVILLALLVPALDKAVYQAELAACGAKLKSLGNAVVTYAAANKRSYPHRPMVDNEIWNCSMLFINTGHAGPVTTGRILDDRTLLKTFLPINKILQCSLAPQEVDLADNKSDTRVFASYAMWFGVQYKGYPESRMKKLGDRLNWTYDNRLYRFSLLAGDIDMLSSATNASPQAQSSHPDSAGTLTQDVQENETNTYSIWSNKVSSQRGLLDTNFVSDDTSVFRSGRVTVEDDRAARIPLPVNAYPDYYLQVPKF